MDLDDTFLNLGQMHLGDEVSNSSDDANSTNMMSNYQEDLIENNMRKENDLHISNHEEWENFKKSIFTGNSLISGHHHHHHHHKKEEEERKKKKKEKKEKEKEKKKKKSIKGNFLHISNYEDESSDDEEEMEEEEEEEEMEEEEEEEMGDYYTPLYTPLKSNAVTISNDRDFENWKRSIFKKDKDLHSFGILNEFDHESSFIGEDMKGDSMFHIKNEQDFEKFKREFSKSSFIGEDMKGDSAFHIKNEQDFEKFKREFSNVGSSSFPSSLSSSSSHKSLSNQIEIMKAKNIAAFFINDAMNVTKLTEKERIKFCNQMNHLEQQLSRPEKKLKLEMIKPSKIKVNISPEHDLKDMSNLIQFNSLVRKHGMDNIFSHKCEDLLDLVHKRTLYAKQEE